MKLQILTPAKSLNKAYFKQSLKREQIELFKSGLQNVFKHADENQDEEYHKNLISQFLISVYCKDKYLVNVNKRQDLVIRLGNNTKDNVGVILEFKKPTERRDMVSAAKPNVKALQELVLYYLRETIDNNNHQIKHLIATNINEWFIFDELWFEKNIYRNTKLKKEYEDWKVSGHDTKHFYELIAAKHLDGIDEELQCAYFNLKDFEKIISNPNKVEDNKLINLYKILSPENLLKKPFVNDSNSLNKEFYSELLHLIGLEETKDGSKKIIQRKRESERNEGSLLENTINILKTRNKVSAFDNAKQFGETADEQVFSIGLELCITWLNRILFLKLLEGQLIKYHRGDKNFAFLNITRIRDFDEINELFFEVLAVPILQRSKSVNDKFGTLPYLNSSLFDESEMEAKSLVIADLKDRLEIPVYNHSVLKEASGKRISGNKNTLQYLFEFLDAYDFSSDSTADIQEQNKTIINASVLGLIFEKINGYKDGSFFTPGFITMYMCRETIRKAVIQKFNEQHKWNCETFSELFNKLDKVNITDANATINSLKICDPAVGSGHFLVSALNEIITIKNDLEILTDSEGKRLRGYIVQTENDELIITNEDEPFVYNYKDKESQRIQETLFHEKQTIIENCLFGVDINPKSVMICRLRLWIELLKNSYYTQASKYTELETLPNIDINIKCGNSLIYRFDVADNYTKLPVPTQQKLKLATSKYKEQVIIYKSTNDKATKKKAEQNIKELKETFSSISNPTDSDYKKWKEAEGKLGLQPLLFSREEQEEWKKKTEKLEEDTKELQEKYEKKLKTLYGNTFEWRFEFPEVLDDDGKFLGFDVIIGNPPYIPLESFGEVERKYFGEKYLQLERKYETSVAFILEGLRLLNLNALLSYIAPITWQTGENYSKFRQHIISKNGIQKVINLPFNIFEDAYVDTALYFLSQNNSDEYSVCAFDKKVKIENLDTVEFETFKIADLKKPDFKLAIDKTAQQFLRFDNDYFIELGLITKSTQGLSGSNFPEGTAEKEENIFPFLSKGNVYNFALVKETTYLTDMTSKQNLVGFYKEEPKVLIRRIISRQDRLSVAYCNEQLVFKKDINPFIPIDENFDAKYLTAILASKFISYLYLNSSTIATKDDFRQTTLTELRKLPIPKIGTEKQKPFIKLVDEILGAKNKNEDTTKLESEIDELVYKLYELTEEEIKIIDDSYK